MEFDPSNDLIHSAGNRVNVGEMKRLYYTRNFRNRNEDRYPRISFNDQLDLFYEKSLSNTCCGGAIGFFHAELLTEEEDENFCESFLVKEEYRLSKEKRRSKRDYFRKLNIHKTDDRRQNYIREAKPEYVAEQQKIDREKDMAKKIPKFLEYGLFYGYRSTCEFGQDQTRWRMHELYQLEHLRYYSEEAKLWPESPGYHEYESQKNIIEDITRTLEP